MSASDLSNAEKALRRRAKMQKTRSMGLQAFASRHDFVVGTGAGVVGEGCGLRWEKREGKREW